MLKQKDFSVNSLAKEAVKRNDEYFDMLIDFLAIRKSRGSISQEVYNAKLYNRIFSKLIKIRDK